VAVTEDVRPIRVTVPALRESERRLASLVDLLDPDAVALADAAGLWKAFDCIERLAAGAKVLLAARVEEAGAWKQAGARSAAEHLARLGPWATSKHTRLDELDPLPHHHKLKTNQNWSLVAGTGRRPFVGPNDARHPRNKPPP
jgi:hypothetical protein